MVARKLNVPVVKVGIYPIFWLREVGSSWWCHACNKTMPQGTAACEIAVKFSGKNVPKENRQDRKIYLCLSCADVTLQKAIDNVRMCNSVGAQGYALLTKI